MTVAALVLAAASLMGCSGVLWWTQEQFRRMETAPAQPYDDAEILAALRAHRAHIEELTDAVADLETSDQEQTLAIAEGIERVDRAERRVRAAVGRARKRMEELGYVDEGLEAEAAQLREVDGDDGPGAGVQPVRQGVGAAENGNSRPDMSAFPGRW